MPIFRHIYLPLFFLFPFFTTKEQDLYSGSSRSSQILRCKYRGICPSRQSPNGHASMSPWLVARRNKSLVLFFMTAYILFRMTYAFSQSSHDDWGKFAFQIPAAFRRSGTLDSQPRAMICTPWQYGLHSLIMRAAISTPVIPALVFSLSFFSSSIISSGT